VAALTELAVIACPEVMVLRYRVLRKLRNNEVLWIFAISWMANS
jgi:hypothetical protein